jgi:hypothetical protein
MPAAIDLPANTRVKVLSSRLHFSAGGLAGKMEEIWFHGFLLWYQLVRFYETSMPCLIRCPRRRFRSDQNGGVWMASNRQYISGMAWGAEMRL